MAKALKINKQIVTFRNYISGYHQDFLLTLTPSYRDFESTESQTDFSDLEMTLSVLEDAIPVKVDDLNNFEICRVIRQLSKKCRQQDIRYTANEMYYTHIFSSLSI